MNLIRHKGKHARPRYRRKRDDFDAYDKNHDERTVTLFAATNQRTGRSHLRVHRINFQTALIFNRYLADPARMTEYLRTLAGAR